MRRRDAWNTSIQHPRLSGDGIIVLGRVMSRMCIGAGAQLSRLVVDFRTRSSGLQPQARTAKGPFLRNAENLDWMLTESFQDMALENFSILTS